MDTWLNIRQGKRPLLMAGNLTERTCARCERTAIVGWGTPPEWLCFAHYEEQLQRVRDIIQTGSKILQTPK